MKELSIEEKAKAYDEAIKVAKEWHTDAQIGFKANLEKLFPGLKESEDERIRKELIEHIKDQQSSFISAPDCRDRYEEEENDKYNSWIAWLEKQGEQKSELKKANDLRTWLYIVDKVLTEFQGIGQYLDNPICKKIADMLREEYCFDDTSSDWDRVYRKGLDAGEIYGYNKAKKEQNPTWTEEDEMMLEGAIEKIGDLGTGEMIKDWLKSLKARFTWKPSDEQMHYLSWIANIKLGNGVVEQEVSKHLNELFDDLKKLKG